MAEATPQSLLLDVKDVARELRISRATVWRLRASGTLPAPIVLSRGLVRWRRSDIEQFVANGRAMQLDAVRSQGLGSNSMADPQLMELAAKFAAKAVKFGTLKFADFIVQSAEILGSATVRKLAPVFRAAWNAAGNLPEYKGKLDAAGDVDSIFAASEDQSTKPPSQNAVADLRGSRTWEMALLWMEENNPQALAEYLKSDQEGLNRRLSQIAKNYLLTLEKLQKAQPNRPLVELQEICQAEWMPVLPGSANQDPLTPAESSLLKKFRKKYSGDNS
jgi:predicted DNA-binding transcriptional regulator AlpA